MAVGRSSQEFPEGGVVPQARTQDDRDHDGRALAVTLQRPRHLDVVAVLRVEEVRTHKQQHDVRRLKVPVDLARKVLPGIDPPVVPHLDQALTLEHGELLLELVAQPFVGVRVRKEQRGQRIL